MDRNEWQSAVILCLTAARAIGQLPLTDLIAAGGRANSIGPLLDPTLWIRKHKAMSEDLALFQAAHPLWEFARQMSEDL
jgi:hypothetical protein